MIDIMRTSASRPDYLKISTEALQEHLKYTGDFRWIIHEDCLDKGRSNKCMKFIKECGLYHKVHRDNPAIGQGPSLITLLNQVKSKYVINFEDDFELLKDVNVDELIKVMDNNPKVNQIGFHKRPIMIRKPNFEKKHVIIDNIDFTVSPHWSFIPSIFRLSYLKPKWQTFNIDCHWKMNDVLKGYRKSVDADWVIKNTGTYFLGRAKNKTLFNKLSQEEYNKIDNGFYARHLGMGNGSVRLGRYGK